MSVLKYRDPKTNLWLPVSGPSAVLTEAPSCVGLGVAGTIANSTFGLIGMNTPMRDPEGWYDAGYLDVVVPRDGVYIITGSLTFQYSGGTGEGIFYVGPRGITTDADAWAVDSITFKSGHWGRCSIAIARYLTAGSTITWGAYQSSGGDVAVYNIDMGVVEQVAGTPGPQGPRGNSQPDRGTAFPGAPWVGERFTRTDIRGGMDFEWNGTYWLSVQQFTINRNTESTTTTGVNLVQDGASLDYLRGGWPHDLDVYVTSIQDSIYQVAPNSISDYREFYFNAEPIGGGTRAVSNTAAITAGAWAPHTDWVWTGSRLFASASSIAGWAVTATTVGSPGATYLQTIFEYRLRAT